MLVGGAAIAAAFGSSLALAATLAQPEPPPPVLPQPEPMLASAVASPSEVPSPPEDYVEAILDRNVFDHENLGAGEPTEKTTSQSTGEDLGLALLAVVIAQPESLSAALIERDGDRNGARGYAIGDLVHDGMTLVEIRHDCVVLETTDGQHVVLNPRPPEERPTRRARARRGKGDDRVHKVGDNHYEVDSALLDEVMSTPRGLRKLGSARPYKRNGEMVGFRLYRIRRGSLGRQVGLRSGDIVTAVNGRPIRSTSDAMALYQELQSARSFEVDVQRRGGRSKRKITLDLR